MYDAPDFDNLPEDLRLIFERAGEESFFAQQAWYGLMATHGREPESHARIYQGEKDERVALVMRVAGRTLSGLSNAFTMEYGPLVGWGAGKAAISRLIAEIGIQRPNWDTIQMTALDPVDESWAALLDGLRSARLVVKPFFDSGTWFEDTRGLDFQRYYDERPSILRNTYARKAKIETQGRVDYRFSAPKEDIEPLIADYEEVYGHSWKEAERFPTFMPNLIRLAFGLGALRMGVIRVDGTPAAAQFWILWRGRAVIYKLAYDERFSKLSLGTVLTMRMIERVLECDKPSEINFGRGDDPYKRLWLPRRRERWGLLAANPRTLRGLKVSARNIAGRLRDRVLSNGPIRS